MKFKQLFRSTIVPILFGLCLILNSACNKTERVERTDFESLKTRHASELSCPQLDFMAKKYASICESATKAASMGDSPASAGSAITATAACNKSASFYGEIARRCY